MLVAVTRELAPRGGVVILVDDAHAMSDACAAALAALYEELGGALRIALAAVQGPAAQRVFRAFGSQIDVVLLAGGMSGREARRYVEMRLAYGGARPELVAAFDEATIDALHRASQGVPRRLNQAAEDVVRRATRTSLPRLRQLARLPRARRSPPRARARRTAGARPRRRARRPPPPTARAAALRALPSRAAADAAPRRGPAACSARPPPARSADRARAAAGAEDADAGEDDDGRGILLPEIFDRVPGEPAGEYRIVRGTPLASTPPRGAAPATPRRTPARARRVLVAPPGGTSRRAPPRAGRSRCRRRTRIACRARAGRRGLPIRLIGVAGFVLGVALSMTWMLGREPDPPRVLPIGSPSRPQPPAKPPAPRRDRTATAPRPREPAPESAAAPQRARPRRPQPRRHRQRARASPCRSTRRRGRSCGSTAARSARRRSRAFRSSRAGTCSRRACPTARRASRRST